MTQLIRSATGQPPYWIRGSHFPIEDQRSQLSLRFFVSRIELEYFLVLADGLVFLTRAPVGARQPQKAARGRREGACLGEKTLGHHGCP
jgi:hypothetical protein